MSASRFHGIIPPVVTPRTATGEIDLISFEQLIEHLIESGVHGLFILGSSGEVAFLTDEERRTVVLEAVRVVAGRVPVVVGINEMTPARMLDQLQLIETAGADAVVATAPFYARPSEAEIEKHFRLLAAATALPIFAYDVPVRVFNKLTVDMLIRLGSEGVITGVKDSSGDDVAFRRLLLANRAAGSPLVLFTGHEVVADGALLWGADGIVPGLGNVDPRRYVEMYDASLVGDWPRVRDLQEQLCALFEIVFQAHGVSGEAAGLGAFKTALVRLDIIASNTMSMPIPALDEHTTSLINDIVDRSGLLVT